MLNQDGDEVSDTSICELVMSGADDVLNPCAGNLWVPLV